MSDDYTPIKPVPVEGIDTGRIARGLGKASDAFWAAMVAEFPEVKTGDMDPLSVFAIEEAMARAAASWLWANHPAARTEDE